MADSFIRSSKLSLKFTNKEKLSKLLEVQKEYTKLVNTFIEILWFLPKDKIPSLLPKELTSQVETWLSKRMVQSAGKQASGIVRGLFRKQNKRIYVYEKLLEENQVKKAKRLKRIIDSFTTTMPKLEIIPMELDSRFVSINDKNNTSFDIWLELSSLGHKLKLNIPLKKTKHFNKLNSTGKRLKGVRIDSRSITFMFEFEKTIKCEGSILGIDIGSLNVITCSNNFQSPSGLGEIQKKLARKKKGSKAYERALKERTNFINYSINQLNLDGIKEVKRENIKNMKKGVRLSRYLTSWTYTDIFDKLDRYCEEKNVSVLKVSPTYTSQRCSVCGWTQKSNRKGKVFKCSSCGHTEDADLNASKNISFNLQEIGKKDRLLQKNRTGFYWNEVGQEFIVPAVKTLDK